MQRLQGGEVALFEPGLFVQVGAGYGTIGGFGAAAGVAQLVSTTGKIGHVTPEFFVGLTAALGLLVVLVVALVPLPLPARVVALIDDRALRDRVRPRYTSRSSGASVIDALEDLDKFQTEVEDQAFKDDADVRIRLAKVAKLREEKAEFVRRAEVERTMRRQLRWALWVALVCLVLVLGCVASLMLRF